MKTLPEKAIPDHLGDRLHDDYWYDEVRLVGTDGPLLRLVTVPRYKTSGLSGDEWRTSVLWQTTLPMEGAEPSDSGPWLDLDGPYNGGYETGCAALFPGIYASQKAFHDVPVHRIEFLRKERCMYVSTNDGQAASLLVTCGHLAWAAVMASDQGMDRDEAWERELCFQPGCALPAVSTYRIRFDYGYHGTGEKKPADRPGRGGQLVYQWRRFCHRHLRRGDCGLSDADRNYIIVDGPGPDSPEASAGARMAESPSVFGGVIDLGA